MKKLTLILLMAMSMYALGRQRIVNRPLVPEPVRFNPFLVSHPAGGWMMKTLAPDWRNHKYSVRLFTDSYRPLNDINFRILNDRLLDNVFYVPVWRGRNGHYCAVTTLEVPAVADTETTTEIDLSGFEDGDAIMFEEYPGYSVELMADPPLPERRTILTYVDGKASNREQVPSTLCDDSSLRVSP